MTAVQERTYELTRERLLEFADTRTDPAERERLIDLAGRWKHNWIPLDAIAAAIKAKQMKGDGKRRPGASRGFLDSRPSTAGKTRFDPKGAAAHSSLTTGVRAKGRPRTSAPVQHMAPTDAVRAKRADLEPRAAAGDRVARAELDRRQAKRAEKAGADTGLRARYDTAATPAEKAAAAAALAEHHRAAGRTTPAKHWDRAAAKHAPTSPAAAAPETPAAAPKPKRGPSKAYREYQQARQEQDRRYETAGVAAPGGITDTSAEEYQRYFGLGEHSGAGQEERVTWAKFQGDRRAGKDHEKRMQAAHDAGMALGLHHGKHGTQPADHEYDAAAAGHDDEAFSGGFSDGVIAGDAHRARQDVIDKSETYREARKAAVQASKSGDHLEAARAHVRAGTAAIDAGDHNAARTHLARATAHKEKSDRASEQAKPPAATPDASPAPTRRGQASARKPLEQLSAEATAAGDTDTAAKLDAARTGETSRPLSETHPVGTTVVARQPGIEQATQGVVAGHTPEGMVKVGYRDRHGNIVQGTFNPAHVTRRIGGPETPDHPAAAQVVRDKAFRAQSAAQTAAAVSSLAGRDVADLRRLAEGKSVKPKVRAAARAELERRGVKLETPEDVAARIGMTFPKPTVRSHALVGPGTVESSTRPRTPREISKALDADPSSVTDEELQRISVHNGRFAPAANEELARRGSPDVHPPRPVENLPRRELREIADGPDPARAAQAREEMQRRTDARRSGSPARGLSDYQTRHDNPTRLQEQQARGTVRLQQGQSINLNTGVVSDSNGNRVTPTAAAPSGQIRIEHSGDGTVVHGTERGDTATNAALKEQGFKWSGRLKAWYLPRTWNESTRSQRVHALQSKLGDKVSVERGDVGKSTSGEEERTQRIARANELAQRHTERAGKLDAEAQRRFDAADRATEGIPFGQPILVGHHSQRRHERALERSHSNMGAGVNAHQDAERARERAASAAARARLEEDPKFLARRIERNAAEHRKVLRTLERADPNDAHTRTLEGIRRDLEGKLSADRAAYAQHGGGQHTRETITPGDVITTRGGDAHVVHKTNAKTVTVPHWEPRLAAAGHTDTIPYSQIDKHGRLEDAKPETLRKMLDRPGLPAAVRSRIAAILRDRGESTS